MDAMPSSQALTSLLWFAAIVALIPLALWALKKLQGGGAALGGMAGAMRVVGSLPLSPSQRIVTVEVGLGASRRWLVLGVTAQQISTLHELPPQGEPVALDAGGGGFAQVLAKLRGGSKP